MQLLNARASRWLMAAAIFILSAVAPQWVSAQTVYATGSSSVTGANSTTYNRLWSVNPTTGAGTNVCGLAESSTAMAVSPIDGLFYYVGRANDNANPTLYSVDPRNCSQVSSVATTLPGAIIRATFCPDGRLYASSSTNVIYEVSASTGNTNRVLNVSGLTGAGSGDFACVNNGDLYTVAATAGGGNYSLYFIARANFQSVATNSTITMVSRGQLDFQGTPNGLTEVTTPVGACAASPAPCLLASTGASNRIIAINSTDGSSSTLTAVVGGALTDLSRSYPLDVAISKTVTPTAVLQGGTVNYTLRVGNAGPGIGASVTVTDPLPTSTYASANWTCTVTNAGSATLVPTACSTATGSGSINNTVSLSVGATVQFNITATLATNFTGTLTNVGGATVSVLITDTNSSNNSSSTTSSTVSPAANLTISKTNGTTTAVSGRTTSYTVTVANLGPGNAGGAVVTDTPQAGLTCSAFSCSATTTGICPTPATSIPFGSLTSGLTLSSFPADSTATFVIPCTVSATGS